MCHYFRMISIEISLHRDRGRTYADCQVPELMTVMLVRALDEIATPPRFKALHVGLLKHACSDLPGAQ